MHQYTATVSSFARIPIMLLFFFACAPSNPTNDSNEPPPVCDHSCTGSFVVTNKSELDAVEGCTRIDGDLSIQADLPDLSRLSCLESVGGNLEIGGDMVIPTDGTTPLKTLGPVHLCSLAGLDRLQTVDGTLRIGGIAINSWVPQEKMEAGPIRLKSLDGMPQLSAIGALEVRMIADIGASEFLDTDLSLTDLSGLDGVRAGNMNIQLPGAPARIPKLVLAEEASVTLAGPAINTVAGPEYPTTVSNLLIDDTTIPNLTGLESVTSVGSATLINNGLLTELLGIGVTSISSLDIHDNPLLSDFSGLHAAQMGALTLATSNVSKALPVTTVDGTVTIAGDADACANLQTAGSLYVHPGINGTSRIMALSSLQTVGTAELLITGQSDLTGLGSLTNVDSLSLSGEFSSLNGLNPEMELSTLSIYRSAIQSFEGFPPAARPRQISIYDNNNISSLSGLENTQPVDLFIQENPHLAQCTIDAWRLRLGLNFDERIAYGNPSGNDMFCACDMDGNPTCPDPDCHKTLSGSYRVDSEAAAAAIEDVDCAELLYLIDGPTTLRLPNLRSAELLVMGAPTPHSLELPALDHVGYFGIGEFATSGGKAPIQVVSAPALRTAYDLMIDSPDHLTTLDLGSLEHIQDLGIFCGDSYVDPTPLESLSLGNLKSATSVTITDCPQLPACSVEADLAMATIGTLNVSGLDESCTCDATGAVLACN